MQIEINKIKILSPSPTTFVINVEQKNGESEESITYIGSGEHCFTDKTLIDSKLAHSTTYFPINTQDSEAEAYALFDMNDVLVAADADSRDVDKPDVNYIIFPSLVEVSDKKSLPLRGAINNKNALFGIMPTTSGNDNIEFPLEATPSRRYTNLTENRYSYTNDNKEAIVLYDKKNNSASIKNVLRVTEEYALAPNQLEELYVIQTFPAFNTSGRSLGAHQNIQQSWSTLVNNFDKGILSATSYITPKQTLNSEYSTEKHPLFAKEIGDASIPTNTSTKPYNYMRSYNPIGEKVNMYASGDLFILNYIENRELQEILLDSSEPFQIQTPYSNNIGLPATKGIIDSGGRRTASINTVNHVDNANTYQHYLPEVLNVMDNAFGSSPPTDSTHGTKRALHKANIFDIDLVSKYNFIGDAAAKITAAYNRNSAPGEDSAPGELQKLQTTLSSNLKKIISNRLQDLVADLIPAHTHLYRVVTDTDAY